MLGPFYCCVHDPFWEKTSVRGDETYESMMVSLRVQCHVRGYHVYQRMWNPFAGEIAAAVPEEGNTQDRFAVAILEGDTCCCVGHLCVNVTPCENNDFSNYASRIYLYIHVYIISCLTSLSFILHCYYASRLERMFSNFASCQKIIFG